jgi:2-polyprenyl-3-methyl-5-hydroxy-6-metoxy-1,4-benzoquinol methylase
MSEADKLKALETYFRLMSMKGVVEVFHAARKTGALDAVAAAPLTARAVAERCSLDIRATALLLDALCAAGVLVRNGDDYGAAPVLQFLSGAYQDLSSQYWNYLPEFLKSGRPMQRMDTPEEGQKQYVAQASSLYWMMLPSATAAARMLKIGVDRRNLNILDIGAGAGVWSLTFAQHDAGARVTAVDWPGVLAVAKGFAERAGLLDRFTTCAGNYHTVNLPSAVFDLAVAANIAHLESEPKLTSLFRRLHASLKPGGCLLLVDVFHGQPGGELSSTLYELGLALRTDSGRVHGRAALDASLAEAGFGGRAYHPIPVPPFTMGMIVAQKGAG